MPRSDHGPTSDATPLVARSGNGWRDEGLFIALCALVALAPLPLGSNRPLPSSFLCMATGVLLIVWALLKRHDDTARTILRIKYPLMLYGATLLWIVIQWLPLGFGDPMWTIASQATNAELASRISVNPDETLSGLMRLIAYVGIFWLSLQLTRRQDRAEKALVWIAAMGGLYAVYGLIVFLSGNEWILFYKKWAYQTALSSTFVNRNSYATFAGLCLLVSMGLLLNQIRHTLNLDWSWRRRLVRLIEILTYRSAWLTGASLVSLLALMLTGSRGGIGCSAIALLVLMIYFLRGSRLRITNLIVVALTIIIIAATALLMGNKTLEKRYASDMVEQSTQMRLDSLGLTLSAIQSAPWTGTGFGTYPDTITAYRDGLIPSSVLWDKAHNTYLENAAELGIPATIALNLSILWLVLICLRGSFTRQRGWLPPAIGVAASLLVAIHATVDFSLQIPAVTTLYAFMMGVAVGQSWRHTPTS